MYVPFDVVIATCSNGSSYWWVIAIIDQFSLICRGIFKFEMMVCGATRTLAFPQHATLDSRMEEGLQ